MTAKTFLTSPPWAPPGNPFLDIMLATLHPLTRCRQSRDGEGKRRIFSDVCGTGRRLAARGAASGGRPIQLIGPIEICGGFFPLLQIVVAESAIEGAVGGVFARRQALYKFFILAVIEVAVEDRVIGLDLAVNLARSLTLTDRFPEQSAEAVSSRLPFSTKSRSVSKTFGVSGMTCPARSSWRSEGSRRKGQNS